jgi:hypothetical protein
LQRVVTFEIDGLLANDTVNIRLSEVSSGNLARDRPYSFLIGHGVIYNTVAIHQAIGVPGMSFQTGARAPE